MVEHSRILLPIKLLNKSFPLQDPGKLCSKFGDDRSTNNVTILSADARHANVILYSVQCYALYLTNENVESDVKWPGLRCRPCHGCNIERLEAQKPSIPHCHQCKPAVPHNRHQIHLHSTLSPTDIIFIYMVSQKNSPFLPLWYLCQISSDSAKFWQKHTPGYLKQTHLHSPVHISFYMFLLYLAKTSDASEGTVRRWPLPVRLVIEPCTITNTKNISDIIMNYK